MRVGIHKDNVEVKAEGCLPDSYQVVVRMDGKERFLTVPKGWCTEKPEQIPRGTMVWYRLPFANEWGPAPRFYERRTQVGHLIAGSRDDDAHDTWSAAEVRLVVDADLQGGKE